MTKPFRPGEEENIVPLPGPDPSPPPPASPPGRLHGLFIAGMAASAFVGIAAMFGFITVGWPGGTGRVVIGVFVASIVVFLGCASAAVLTAARDTYPTRNADPLD